MHGAPGARTPHAARLHAAIRAAVGDADGPGAGDEVEQVAEQRHGGLADAPVGVREAGLEGRQEGVEGLPPVGLPPGGGDARGAPVKLGPPLVAPRGA